jgi:hypothetical protein
MELTDAASTSERGRVKDTISKIMGAGFEHYLRSITMTLCIHFLSHRELGSQPGFLSGVHPASQFEKNITPASQCTMVNSNHAQKERSRGAGPQSNEKEWKAFQIIREVDPTSESLHTPPRAGCSYPTPALEGSASQPPIPPIPE